MRNFLLLSTILLVTIFTSCKKDKVVKATNISNGQAAVMVATALSVNSNGFVSIKNDVVIYAKAVTNAGKGCGVIDSFAVARQDATTSTINYNYALGYYYVVNCNNNVQDNLTSNVIYNGSFDAATLSAINAVTTSVNVSSLSATGTTYSLKGNYQTQGTFNTLDETLLSGTNTINIDVTNLVVNRSNRNIVSGTANVVVAGSVKNKNSFTYNGTLIFNNAGTAVLSLEGVNYTINLTTADITAI